MAESDYERRMEVDHEEELLDFEGSSHGDPSDHEGGATLAKKKKKKKARGKRQVSAPPAFDINRLPSRGPAGLSPTQRQKAVKQQKSKKRVQFSDHVPAVGVTGAAQEAVDEPKEPPSSPVVAPAPTIADLVADAEPAAAPLGSPRQRDAATRKRLTIKIGKRKDQAKQQAVEQLATGTCRCRVCHSSSGCCRPRLQRSVPRSDWHSRTALSAPRTTPLLHSSKQ